MIWQELGISGGTALIVLAALYFVIKGAVKNGIKGACRELSEGEEVRHKKWKDILEQLD